MQRLGELADQIEEAKKLGFCIFGTPQYYSSKPV